MGHGISQHRFVEVLLKAPGGLFLACVESLMRNPITLLLASLGILLVGQGVQLSLLPLFARTLGWSDAEIGITGAMYYLGFVVGCLMAPRILARSGHIRVFLTLAGISTASLLILEISRQYWLWMALRFLIGWCLSAIYVTTESWLNEHSANETRGKILSIYVLVTLVGIGLGQQLLAILPFEMLFRVSATIMLLSLVPLGLFASEQTMNLQAARLRFGLLRDIPSVASAGIFLSGIVTGSLWTMAPLAGDAKGLSPAMIGYMMNAMVLGGAVFQFPLGAASDLLGRRQLIATLALGCSANALLVLIMPNMEMAGLMLTMFIFGGTSLTAYAMCAAEAYDLSSSSKTEISAVLLLLNGLGSMIGPVITGVVSTYTQDALFVVALFSMGMLLLLIFLQVMINTKFQKNADIGSVSNEIDADLSLVPVVGADQIDSNLVVFVSQTDLLSADNALSRGKAA